MKGMTGMFYWWLGQTSRDPRMMMVIGRLGRGCLAIAMLLMVPMTDLHAAEPTMLARSGVEQMSESHLRQLLLTHFARWEGVPYEYGGYDRRGIDCSGFVNLTFKQALGVDIPRSTQLLASQGKRVARSALAVGDVLVFRTASKTLHVGIYVGDGQFIHASKSRGVMLSDVDSPYWRDVYIKAVRFLHTRTRA